MYATIDVSYTAAYMYFDSCFAEVQKLYIIPIDRNAAVFEDGIYKWESFAFYDNPVSIVSRCEIG